MCKLKICFWKHPILWLRYEYHCKCIREIIQKQAKITDKIFYIKNVAINKES